jgi:CSLREA domain-containing protein
MQKESMMNRYRIINATYLIGLILVAGVIAVAMMPATYAATTIIVNSTADVLNGSDGQCTLREAVIAANNDTASGPAPGECPAGSGVDTITFFDSGTSAIYTLTIVGAGEDAAATGDLDIIEAVHVTGNGREMTIIEAAPGFRDRVVHILHTGADGEAVLEALTIRNGDLLTIGNGGGILNANASRLAVLSSTLGNNRASHGGALVNESGNVRIANSSLEQNQASNQGGAIFNTGFGTVNLEATVLRDNTAISGGGIFNEDGIAILRDTTVDNNTASSGPAGGILSGGILTITDSTLSGNIANEVGGAILSVPSPTGTLTIAGSTLTQNVSGLDGGGIFNGGGQMTINSTTLDHNLADNGGGIYSSGMITVTNSTLSQNQALAGFGGGIYNDGPSSSMAMLSNVTLAQNEAALNGGGLYNDGGTITLINTISTENTPGGDCFNNSGSITDGGHNMDSDTTCGLAAPSIPGGNANLGPLQNNGGLTQTHALQDGSQAIDRGNNGICPTTDQRGEPRPQDGNVDGSAVCDIGAYERTTIYKGYLPFISSDSN